MFKFNKKRIILVVITVSLVFFLSMSCGFCEAKYKFNLTNANNQWGEGTVHSELFAEAIRMATGGEVDITIFPNAEWGGSEEDYLKELELGTLDMSVLSISPISQYTNVLKVFGIPFLFKGTTEETLFIFDSATKFTPFVEKLIERVNKETNFILLSLVPTGRRDVFSNKPLNSIKDLKGLKIRTLGSNTQVDAFNFAGAIATPLPFSDCFTSLQLKVIDAMENTPVTYITKRYFEVAPYWMGTSHYNDVMGIVMSKKAWNSLPLAYQNIVKNTAISAAYMEAQWAIGAAEFLLKGEVKKVAKTMYYPSKEELKELREKALPKLLDKYSKEIGMDVIETLAEKDEFIKNWYEKNK